ncbi:ABC transporter ATP-binding protein [Microbacterium arborescens]|uniref:ABC transporter ATP-binding protein n=1 Tax=Microbacterium arborescens TaxID=33883 RepID=UPI0025A068A0|nr:ATP-binding cassette domain-containing protein [Microbacterium arborescens]WJM17033.1 ATP-binding cassette domain-containing protein [Microbacterium arborescens]
MTDDSAAPQHEQRVASPVDTSVPPLPDIPAEVAAAGLGPTVTPGSGSHDGTTTSAPRTPKPRKPRSQGTAGAKKTPRKPRSTSAPSAATPPKPEIPAAVAAAAFVAPPEPPETESVGAEDTIAADVIADDGGAADVASADVASDTAASDTAASDDEVVGGAVGPATAEPELDTADETPLEPDVEPEPEPEVETAEQPEPQLEQLVAPEQERAHEAETISEEPPAHEAAVAPELDASVVPEEEPEREPLPEPPAAAGDAVADEVVADVETVLAAEPEAATVDAPPVDDAPVDDDEARDVVGAGAVAMSDGSDERMPADLASSAPALRLRGVTKTYGEARAVDRIDLEIPAGSFYGLVGPNGAGKTTTLSMIAGLLRPDEGSVEIAGVDIRRDPAAAKRQMGVLPDRLRTFDRLSGRQLLYYYGVLRGLKPAVVENRIADLASAFDLTDALGRSVSDYSAGMTKKVMLAGAMIHAPRLLVLDEPFESVDPVSSAVILDILQKYVAHGGTVILSSHGMELVQRACSGVAVVVGGRILAAGTVDEVRDGRTLEERFLELAGGTSAVEGLEWLHTFSD